ncbi:hypothetical protein SESBI_45537 [Sesbania bispinosa]|nr:hypothetical protein SESBI_45537 [Sesbania bispinosa]
MDEAQITMRSKEGQDVVVLLAGEREERWLQPHDSDPRSYYSHQLEEEATVILT